MPADGGGGFDRQVLDRKVRNQQEGLRIKDNLLHWCKEADRQLNAFLYPERVQSSLRGDVAQPEEQLSPEQFRTEVVTPLLILRDFLNEKEPLHLFEARMPKQAVIRDMAGKLLDHGRDLDWFKSKDIEELREQLDFFGKRVEEWEAKSGS